MSTLAERLRHGVEWLRGSRYNGSADLMQEAADEIERLRAALAAEPQPLDFEIERLRDLNRQLVDKANSYVIHNARLDEENKCLRAELSRANNSFGSETADWPGLAERIEDLKARLRAAPTAQPLTDEQIDNLLEESDWPASLVSPFVRKKLVALARAIERAHGIGGTHG